MTPRDAIDQAIGEAALTSRNNSRKWGSLYKAFAEHLGVQTGVVGKLLTEDKQLGNRLAAEMVRTNPRYVVLTILTDGDVRLERVKEYLAERVTMPAARCALIVEFDEVRGRLTPLELQVYRPDRVVDDLIDLYPEATPMSVTRPETARDGEPGAPRQATGTGGGATKPMVHVPMVLDDRIRRAIRISVQSTSAVLLVGPPGTGKTTLLEEIAHDIGSDPGAFGFEAGIAEPMTVTSEESWSARDLIGGMTVAEDGALQFREGYVLRAIRENRWLILDEANRADLDKIFGALLTWLSDQEVDLGPASTEPEAPSVRLGWSEEGSSKVELDGDIPVRYLAGREWRLLGTYNALDAQRVFRFGQALGRRFLRVPVPPLEPDEFADAAEPVLVKLPVVGREAVADLYAAHFASEETQLGPALFMRMPDYVLTGLEAAGEGDDPDTDHLQQLVAEAYLVNVGAFLARHDEETLAALGDRVVASGALPEEEWRWVSDLSRHLS